MSLQNYCRIPIAVTLPLDTALYEFGRKAFPSPPSVPKPSSSPSSSAAQAATSKTIETFAMTIAVGIIISWIVAMNLSEAAKKNEEMMSDSKKEETMSDSKKEDEEESDIIAALKRELIAAKEEAQETIALSQKKIDDMERE